MVLKRRSLAGLLLLLAALSASGLFASVPHQGLPLLPVLAALLPLQLAAVFWSLGVAPKAVARRFPGPTLPASD